MSVTYNLNNIYKIEECGLATKDHWFVLVEDFSNIVIFREFGLPLGEIYTRPNATF